MRIASGKLGLVAVALVAMSGGWIARADEPAVEPDGDTYAVVERRVVGESPVAKGPTFADDVRIAKDWGARGLSWVRGWYRRTPPSDRVVWGGLVACGVLGVGVFLERLLRIRPRRVVPADFTSRFLDQIHDGRLDCGGALDHCESRPSPAARVALAAVRRWGRPAADLERAVLLAQRVESDRLKRNIGSLRRIAALAPLLGLLGTLFALSRTLESTPTPIAPGPAMRAVPVVASVAETAAWGRALAATLAPLTVGIIIAAISLVAYDALMIRVEKLTGALDRLGTETIDAIAMTAPISTPHLKFGRSPGAALDSALTPRHDPPAVHTPRQDTAEG